MSGGRASVTVVMITHNRREEVLRSLAHLERMPEQPTIVVVDNGSGDGTASAVASRFPLVKLVRLEENRGAAGRTVGVHQAGTPYVAFCDDDTWWEDGALALAAALFTAHSRLAVITARILVGPENREDPICAELREARCRTSPSCPAIRSSVSWRVPR